MTQYRKFFVDFIKKVGILFFCFHRNHKYKIIKPNHETYLSLQITHIKENFLQKCLVFFSFFSTLEPLRVFSHEFFDWCLFYHPNLGPFLEIWLESEYDLLEKNKIIQFHEKKIMYIVLIIRYVVGIKNRFDEKMYKYLSLGHPVWLDFFPN